MISQDKLYVLMVILPSDRTFSFMSNSDQSEYFSGQDTFISFMIYVRFLAGTFVKIVSTLFHHDMVNNQRLISVFAIQCKYLSIFLCATITLKALFLNFTERPVQAIEIIDLAHSFSIIGYRRLSRILCLGCTFQQVILDIL